MKEYFKMTWWMLSFKRNQLGNRPLAIVLGIIGWASLFLFFISSYMLIKAI